MAVASDLLCQEGLHDLWEAPASDPGDWNTSPPIEEELAYISSLTTRTQLKIITAYAGYLRAILEGK